MNLIEFLYFDQVLCVLVGSSDMNAFLYRDFMHCDLYMIVWIVFRVRVLFTSSISKKHNPQKERKKGTKSQKASLIHKKDSHHQSLSHTSCQALF